MSLTLSDYTDNDTLRGLLGVSEAEIPDDILETLSAGNLLEVTFALEDINLQVPVLFESYKNMAVSTRTALQSRFYSVVRLFAAYIVAEKIANGAIALFAPVTIQDGRTSMQQRDDDPYSSLRTAIKASLTVWRKRLNDTLALIDVTLQKPTPTLTLVSGAGLPIDPVTGA